MLNIELLKYHTDAIPILAEMLYEQIGEIWVPNASVEACIQKLNEHLNIDKLPMTFVALLDSKPIGMCSLRENDGIRADLTPWLGSLVVHPKYQNQGTGGKLIQIIKNKAKDLGYPSLYLFAFDPNLASYYKTYGFETMAQDEFKNQSVIVMKCVDL